MTKGATYGSWFAIGVALASAASGAQTAPLADEAGTAPAVATGATSQSLGSDASGEILVTARRKSERLQDVPVAVQAFSPETLTAKGIERVSDLVNVTPTLKISSSSQRRAAPAYELRAISSTESNIGQDSPVALYIDEVYVPRPAGSNGSLIDLENVQVLLGPQGTLFGRNATAGAILFTSKKPTHDLSGEASVTIGNYNQQRYTAIANVPFGDNLAVRLVGSRSLRDGYTYDVTNKQDLDNENNYFGRASVKAWLGSLENTLIADIFVANENGSGSVNLGVRRLADPRAPGQAAPILAALNTDARITQFLADQAQRGPRSVAFSPYPLFSKVRAHGVSNITTFDVSDNMSVKNILGYRFATLRTLSDLDGTPFLGVSTYVAEHSSSLSNELQLQGKGFDSALDYIVGLYYFREKGYYQSDAFQFGAITPVLNARGTNTSYSAYAQATYHVPAVEGLSLTAGARYTHDKREILYRPPAAQQFDNPFGPIQCTYAPAVPNCTNGNQKSFNKPTYTVSVDYKVSPDILIYAAHRRGYRSGGFESRNNNTLAQRVPFAPETVTDVELGLKANWRLGSDVRLLTNFATYYDWYDNIQRTVAVAATNPATGGVSLVTTIANAAKATIKGFEANVELHFSDQLTFALYYGYADSIHKEFNTTIAGVATSLKNQPFGAMKNSGGASISASPDIGPDNGRVTMSMNAAYSGHYFNTTSINSTNPALPFLDQSGRVPSRVIFNASIGWDNIRNSPFSALFFVRNLTNKEYLVSTLALTDGPAGFTSGLYGEPRMYGMTLKVALGAR